MRDLTEKLWNRNIRFRWEMPLGITFTWKDRQVTIRTEEQKDAFLKENRKDLSD